MIHFKFIYDMELKYLPMCVQQLVSFKNVYSYLFKNCYCKKKQHFQLYIISQKAKEKKEKNPDMGL